MTVRVKLFAVARQIAGCDELTIEVADGATVADVRQTVAASFPALADTLRYSAWAIDAAYADDDATLDEHSEIALIPPVSGG